MAYSQILDPTDPIQIKDLNSMFQELYKIMSAHRIEPGTVVMWAGAYNQLPPGFLDCFGDEVSRKSFADLFARIGTRFGAGNGTTTFNLPNLKGKAVFGYDAAQTEFNAVGKTGGEKTHILTVNEIPAHRHNLNGRYGTDTPSSSGTAFGLPLTSAGTTSRNYVDALSNAGGGAGHNTLPPFAVMKYIIKY